MMYLRTLLTSLIAITCGCLSLTSCFLEKNPDNWEGYENQNTNLTTLAQVCYFIQSQDPPTESGSICFIPGNHHYVLWCDEGCTTVVFGVNYKVPNTSYNLDLSFFAKKNDEIISSSYTINEIGNLSWSHYSSYNNKFENHKLVCYRQVSEEGNSLTKEQNEIYESHYDRLAVNLISALSEFLVDNNLPYFY